MTLGHHIKKDDIVLDVLVEYNPETKEAEELIHIIAIDLSDGAEVELSTLLSDKFPSILLYLVNSVNWELVYETSKDSIEMVK